MLRTALLQVRKKAQTTAASSLAGHGAPAFSGSTAVPQGAAGLGHSFGRVDVERGEAVTTASGGGVPGVRQQAELPRWQFTPTSVRYDDFPFHKLQPTINPATKKPFGTPKAHIDPTGRLHPVAPHGSTTPAGHVHGKPEDKSDSPFISFSMQRPGEDYTGNGYGDHLIEHRTHENVDAYNAGTGGTEMVSQQGIQEDISASSDPRLDQVARNVSQKSEAEPEGPLWKPDPGQISAAPGLGVDPGKAEFDYRDRAKLNSHRDREVFTKGSVPPEMYRLWMLNKIRHPGAQRLDWSKIGAKQGRPPQSLHPAGFRIPLSQEDVSWRAQYEAAKQRARDNLEEAKENTERDGDG